MRFNSVTEQKKDLIPNLYRHFTFLLLFLGLGLITSALHAQTLKSNDNLPTLDACYQAEEFIVRVQKGTKSCPAGKLFIALPDGLEYVLGSAKVDGVSVTEVDASIAGASLLLDIPSGTSSEELVITYQAKANCTAISVVDPLEVSYRLEGCGDPQTSVSNVINIDFAFLKVTVTPELVEGLVGQTIDRLITVKNTGNGGITGFTLAVTYGSGLERVKGTETGDWSFDEATGIYTYAGTLASGANYSEISFTEKVKILDCTDLTSTYRAYYGCTTECLAGSSGLVKPIIKINDKDRPKIKITKKTTPDITCLNQAFKHVWTITNEGTVAASSIAIHMGTSTGLGSSYIVAGSVKVAGAAAVEDLGNPIPAAKGDLYNTTGKAERISIVIPSLEPGASVDIEFLQYYASPIPTADCSKIPASFVEGQTYYLGDYVDLLGCDGSGTPPNYTIDSLVTKNGLPYIFSGENMGDVDIVDDGGYPGYEAVFLIDKWVIPVEGIESGAYFEFKIKLSSALLPFDPATIKIFDGNKYVSPADYTVSNGSAAGEYTVRIDYEGAIWPLGSALYFPEGGWRIEFPLALNCPATDVFYEISAALNKGGSCTENIPFRCHKVQLNAHCADDCPEGGLSNGLAKLKRLTLGYADANNDARPDNNILLKPGDDLTGIQTHSFTAGDTVRVVQRGSVIAGTTGTNPLMGWTDGKFVVTVPAGLDAEAVPRSGIISVTRTVPNLMYNLPIIKEGDKYILSLSLADIANDPEAVFEGLDLEEYFRYTGLEVSIDFVIKSQTAATGLKEFPTEFYFTKDGQKYSCGGGYKATGYYGSTVLKTGSTGAVYNMKDCSSAEAGPAWMSSVELGGHHIKNALFVNEFRQFATLKKVKFEVPAGLTMTDYKVIIHHNAPGAALSKVVPITPVSGELHEIDLKDVMEELKGGTTGGYLDEGFEIYVHPIVRINCAALKIETIKATSVFAGTFRYNNKDYFDEDEVETIVQRLKYNTDSGALDIKFANDFVNTTTREASWRVAVKNNSANRSFNNVWLGKSGGSVTTDIVRVQQITSLTDTTHIGLAVPAAGSIFQLGDVAKESTSYYLVTALLTDCESGAIEIVTGADCNGYPNDLVNACKSTPVKLSYDFEEGLLQADITQLTPVTGNIIGTCTEIPYLVEINNAGGEATDLTLRIPLSDMPDFKFLEGSLQVSDVYDDEEPNPAMIPLPDLGNIVSDNEGLMITIPRSHLAQLYQGERFYIGFKMVIEGCDFISGRRFKVIPGGKNFCGSDISQISTAESNRIIIQGAPLDEPFVKLSSAVALDQTSVDGKLHAFYNFNLENTKNNNIGYPLTGTAAHLIDPAAYVYSLAVKLPTGWELDGKPQDLIPENQAIFKEISAEKAYVFTLNETLAVGEALKIENAKLVYINNDVGSLVCGHDFGAVHVELFTTYSTQGSVCVTPVTCDAKLITAEEETAFQLLVPAMPIAAVEQTFCESDAVTLADVAVSNPFNLTWYDSPTSTVELSLTTVLEAGKTYYAVNQIMAGSACVSDRLAITIKLTEAPVANAGPDQESFDNGVFVLNANQPATGQTGLWTVISSTLNPVLIADPTLYNTTVTIPNGGQAALKWTVANGSCMAADSMWVKVKQVVDLSIAKSADKERYKVGDEITYSLTVKNNGPGSLFKDQAFQIIDELPKSLINVRYLAVGGTYTVADQLFKLAADLPKDAVVSLKVIATIDIDFEGALILNKASVLPPSGVDDPNLGNNDDEETILIERQTDIVVHKKADQATVIAGKELSYTIEIVNNGSASLAKGEELLIQESWPLGFELLSTATSTGAFDPKTGLLKLTAVFAKADKILLTIKGKVLSNFVGASIYNTVTVSVPPGVTDPNLENNTDDETVEVNRVTDLRVIKTVADQKPIMGTETTFNIQVSNNGPSDATGVKVQDLLASGYRYISSTVTKGSYVPSTGLWTVGNMLNGSVETMTVTVKVLAGDNYANKATVTGNEKDPDLGNNEVVIVPVPVLSPPIAVDDRETTKVNTAVDIDIPVNDKPGLTNSPLVPSSIEIISQPQNGRIEVLADGTVIYTPNPGFVGEDTFVYRIQDELGFWSNHATVTITIEANDFFIPNIFTPNGDGTNDTFEIVGLEGFDRVALTILNRWGNEVYRNNKYDNKWAGKGLNEGTYYYIVTLYKAGTEKILKGWVVIKSK